MKVMVDEFIKELDSKRASKNTIASYERDILKFEEYFEKNGKDVFKIDTKDLEEYLDLLRVEGKSNSTISRATSSVKAYYKFLLSKKVVEKNIANDVENSKVEKKEPTILTRQEIEELLIQPKSTDLKGERDNCMLKVLYATGMRVTELISLKVADINLASRTIKVSKGKIYRVVKINNSTTNELSHYIKDVRPLLAKIETDDTLFLNSNGKKLTRQGFWKILKQYKESAKITKELTPHTLRHSFAIHKLEDGMDIKELQTVLGHTDVATTMMYSNYLNEHGVNKIEL